MQWVPNTGYPWVHKNVQWEFTQGRQSFTWWGYVKQWVPKTGYPWSYDLSLLAIGSNSRGRKAHLFVNIIFKGKFLQHFVELIYLQLQ